MSRRCCFFLHSRLASSSAKQEYRTSLFGAARCHYADASTCCRQPAHIQTAAGPPRPFFSMPLSWSSASWHRTRHLVAVLHEPKLTPKRATRNIAA
ncbi:hypothetical protein HDV64DRAFT_264214 [Trichoderma sp. TUCIM 5745]